MDSRIVNMRDMTPRVRLGGGGNTHNCLNEVSPEKTPSGSDVSWLLPRYLRDGTKIKD